MGRRNGARRRTRVLLAAGLIVIIGVVVAFVSGSPGMTAGGALVALCGSAIFIVELLGEQGFSLRMARLPLGSGWRLPDGR